MSTLLRTARPVLPAVLLLLALLPCPAWAHAVLLGSTPEDGARLAASPPELRLAFSEPVLPVAVRLIGPDGSELPGLVVLPADGTLRIRLPGPLAQGAWLLSYRVTSVDGHPVGATLRFGVGVDAAGPAPVATGDPWPARAGVALRALLYVTALRAVGLTLFTLLVRPPPRVAGRAWRWAGQLALLALPCLLLRLGIAGIELRGLPLAALVTAEPWRTAAATSLGSASALALPALLALAWSARRRTRWALAAAVAVAASFALTGHAATAEPRWLMAPALTLHVLCGAFWLGALPALLWTQHRPTPEAAGVLERFSLLAMGCVALLLLAGAGLAFVQLGGRLEPLATTAYGLRLLLKLALVALLLAVAAVNRFALTPALAQGRPAGRWRARALLLDLALGAAVLAVTATLPLSPPPRAEAGLPSPAAVVATSQGRRATFTLVPGHAGANRLEAHIVDAAGEPVAAAEATLLVSLPEAGLEPGRYRLEPAGPGRFATTLDLPRPGRWRLRLDLLVDDFTKLILEAELDLPAG